MRENLIVLGLTAAIVVCTIGIVKLTENRPSRPPRIIDTNCKLLEVDYEFYTDDDKSRNILVRLPTGCLETTNDPQEFVYRKIAGEKPRISCFFSKKPEREPEYLIGRCVGKKDGTIVIVECFPTQKP